MAEAFYIPSEEGWRCTGAYSCYFMRMAVTRNYDVATNRSTFTVVLQAKGDSRAYSGTYRITRGTLSCGGSTLCSFSGGHTVVIYGDETWRDVTTGGGTARWTFDKTHDADGYLTVSFALWDSLRVTAYISGADRYGDFHYVSDKSFSEPRSSSIASYTADIATLGTFSLSVNRASSTFYHITTITYGGNTLYTSEVFDVVMESFTVPRAWFNSLSRDTSFHATVSVQTYTDSSCSATVGSAVTAELTVTADSGMKPTLASGFASAAPLNAGTIAAAITGYVQGVSKARITLDATKVTHAEGASLGSYRVTCQSYTGTGTGTSYDTDVLTGAASITVTVIVTDSRGRSSSVKLTITPMAYSAPILSDVSAFRCGSSGSEDEDGTYYAVQATASYSGLNGQNSASLTVQKRVTGGSYDSAVSLTSGVQAVLSTVNPDSSYDVLFTATDALGSTTTALVVIPTRQWAMKFRPDGKGVAFGKAPVYGNAVEIPENWSFIQGERQFQMTGQTVAFKVFIQSQGTGFQFILSNTEDEMYRLNITESAIGLDKLENSQWVSKWTLSP